MRSLIFLVAIVLLGFALRIWGITNGLPYSQLTDETSDISVSMGIASGEVPQYTYHRVTWPVTQLPFHALYFLSLKLTHPNFSVGDFEALYFTERGNFILLARLVLAVLATLAIVPIFFAVRVITKSDLSALFGALLLAIYPAHVYLSHIALPDAYSTLGVSLALLACVAIVTNGRRWAYLLAGAVAALIALTRLQAITIIVSIMLAHVVFSFRQETWPKRRTLLIRWLWCAAAFIVAHLILNPFVWLQPGAAVADLHFVFDAHYTGTYYQLTNAATGLASDVQNMQANLSLPIRFMRWYLLIPALIGTLFGIRRLKWEIIVVAVFGFVFTISILPTPHPRITYWLPGVVPVAILAAYGASCLMQDRRKLTKFIAAAGSALILLLALWETVAADRILANDETRMLAHDYIIQNIPPGSNILTGNTFTYSVHLERTETSIQRLAALDKDLAPSYQFQLENPQAIREPRYNLFGPEYQPTIKDDAGWWQFVRDNHIEYVIEADYCGGNQEANYEATSSLEFPPISAAVRSQLDLIQVFSPFVSDDCEHVIPNRTALDNMDFQDWVRIGPLVRIYEVAQ